MNVESLLCEFIAVPTHQADPAQPARQGDERALCERIAPYCAALGAQVEIVNAPRKSGDPGAYLWATWGPAHTIINAHLDTVPPNHGWTRDPFTPCVADDRIYGLGACDTKGAIAAALMAMARLPNAARTGCGLLFSGDEERGTASVTQFLQSPQAAAVRRVVVCEPSNRTAGIAHRGVLAYRITATGEGGHSSKADHLRKPIASLARVATALDDYAATHVHSGPPAMPGTCMNLAALRGGVAFNVVPTTAELEFSLRPAPGFDRAGWETTLRALCDQVDPTLHIACLVDHAPFAANDANAVTHWLSNIAPAVPLDFWTEAALWSAAGKEAVVIGPGAIAQAHTADEWVAIADLAWAVDVFMHLLGAAQ